MCVFLLILEDLSFFFFALKQKDKERNNLMIQIKKGKALVCVIFWQEGTEG